jgi:hypothetical protein
MPELPAIGANDGGQETCKLKQWPSGIAGRDAMDMVDLGQTPSKNPRYHDVGIGTVAKSLGHQPNTH